jgi:hypothetical protein
VRLSGGAAAAAGGREVVVSLTHSRETAGAVAMVGDCGAGGGGGPPLSLARWSGCGRRRWSSGEKRKTFGGPPPPPAVRVPVALARTSGRHIFSGASEGPGWSAADAGPRERPRKFNCDVPSLSLFYLSQKRSASGTLGDVRREGMGVPPNVLRFSPEPHLVRLKPIQRASERGGIPIPSRQVP